MQFNMDSAVPLALAILQISVLKPEITHPPSNQTTVVGKTVSFTCRYLGGYKPRLEWRIGSWPLRGHKYRTLESGDLVISYVNRRDAYPYTCHVFNRFSHVVASANLVVKNHTTIIEKPKNYESAVGSTAKFRCIAVSDSSLKVSIDWLRNGKQIDFDMESRVIKSIDNSLTVTEIRESDLGTYTCVASTELDETKAGATLMFQNVSKPPRLEVVNCRRNEADIHWVPAMGNNGVADILGYTIQFKTSFTPERWQIARENVSATAQIYTVPLSPWANYTFQVVAWNEIGKSLPSLPSKACTTPPDVPYKNPDDVRGTVTKEQKLVIRWTIMPEIEHNGPGFKYRVYFKLDTPGMNWTRLAVHIWTIEEIRITVQPADQRYKVKVAAMNYLGESRATPTEVVVDSAGDNETKMVRRQTAQSRRLLEDPVLMNICLERARKDLSTAHRKIAELEDTFREVVPKWELERLENRHQAFEREYRNLSQEFEALSKEHDALKVNFEVVREQKNSLRDRCKILAHTNTPRPDWSKCGQFIQGGVQRWRDITAKKSSEDRLTILLSELCGVASAENDYFVGQGTDPSVPVFLRYKGKMKNRKLGRREVSILINDIWKSRMASDMGTPMGEYVLKYFSERYHISLLRYEWIYNLYYACQRLVYDDQIGLFWNILWGNVVEEAYHAPRKEFVLLKRMMEMRMEDKKINALLAQDLMDVMDVMYPQKSNRDIENIVYAAGKQLGIDPSTEAFDVAKLFAQTEEGWERGDFARELARQTKQEITEFGKGILHSINIHDKTSEVTVEMLKKGFMEVDEDIHQNLLTQHLKWIYKVQDLSKAKPMVSSAIIRQMLNGYIRRSQLKNHRRN